jgi:hemerythrin
VVEKIPLAEFAALEAHKKIHADLIDNYCAKNWIYCEHAIEALMGRWNNELDTFYSDLLLRVIGYKDSPPDADWDGTRVRV